MKCCMAASGKHTISCSFIYSAHKLSYLYILHMDTKTKIVEDETLKIPQG